MARCAHLQVYIRSLADSDGDGIGDLEGIRSRLDHIAGLGVDAIWLNPCYPSPQHDHGYDIANYFDMHDEYGTLDDFDQLVADAREHGIKILMDLVPGHCSEDHRWFVAARDARPGSPERSRFYFRDGKGENGSEPPNNWQSAFGGPAWTRINDNPDDGQWYLHTFTREQPDLPDQPPVGPDAGVLDITWLNPYLVFRPEGHAVWRRFRSAVDAYSERHPGREPMMVAEAYAVRRPEIIKAFTEPDQFHQMFSFDLMMAPWEKHSIELAVQDPLAILDETGIAPAWTLNNHDIQRMVTRLGRADAHLPESWTNNNLALSRSGIDIAIGERRARAMSSLIFALPGSLYLYQGEEFGLPEVIDIPPERREDPVFERTGGEELGRDGCRIPLPWTDAPTTSYGFSAPSEDGNVAEPWLPQPEGWGERSLATLDGIEFSTLELYRRLGKVRLARVVNQAARAELIEFGPGLVSVRRGNLVVVVNATMTALDLDMSHHELAGAKPVYASEPDETTITGILPANSTVWFVTSESEGR